MKTRTLLAALLVVPAVFGLLLLSGCCGKCAGKKAATKEAAAGGCGGECACKHRSGGMVIVVSEGEFEEDAEESIDFDDMPYAVRVAAKAGAKGGRIVEVGAEAEGGVTYYTVEYIRDGLEGMVGIAETGEVAWRAEDTTLEGLPETVRAAILETAAGAPIEDVHATWRGDKAFYRVEWEVDGRDAVVWFDETGKVLRGDHEESDGEDDGHDEDEGEVEVAFEDLPDAVKASVEAEAKGAQIEEVEMMTRDDGTYYMVEFVRDGIECEIVFDAAGEVVALEAEITLDAVPEAVREAILKAADGAEIEEVEMITAHGVTRYEAEWVVDGKEVEILLDAEGQVLRMEIEDDGDDDDDDDDDYDDEEDDD